MGLYEDADIYSKMRMDRPTFWSVVHTLRPMMEKKTNNFGRTKPIDKRVAIAINHYAHGGTYEPERSLACLALLHMAL